MTIDGRFWLTKGGENFLGIGRIELLDQIAKTGSINAAAKAMKMSYKAAWERINQMNALADFPIIERTTGGRGGGGTVLTPHAYELISTFKRFNELHREFITRFAEAGDDPERLARILSRTFLTTSARNQLTCKVESVEEHGVNGTLSLRLSGGDRLDADITLKSIRSMGLAKGCNAYALIKSSDVAIEVSRPQSDPAMNILEGRITKIETSEENAEITFILKGAKTLIGVMNLPKSRDLEAGMDAFACIAKRHIILGM